MKEYRITFSQNGPHFHAYAITWINTEDMTHGTIEDLFHSDALEFGKVLTERGYNEC